MFWTVLNLSIFYILLTSDCKLQSPSQAKAKAIAELCLTLLSSDLIMGGHFLIVLNLRNPHDLCGNVH